MNEAPPQTTLTDAMWEVQWLSTEVLRERQKRQLGALLTCTNLQIEPDAIIASSHGEVALASRNAHPMQSVVLVEILILTDPGKSAISYQKFIYKKL